MEEVRKQVLHNWDAIAKPIDGLGSFETLTAQIGAITGEEKIDISKKAVLILCADNGIVEENVSQEPISYRWISVYRTGRRFTVS